MRLCVAVCTRNRAESLARALDSLARCAPPRHAFWHALVVDNDSRDATPVVLEAFRTRLPLVPLHEPRAGLSHARNAALAAVADDDYLIWTDDDVTVCRDWLRVYEAGFEAHPEAAFFGGTIRLRFEGTPPRWLTRSLPLLHSAFAGLELPGQTQPFDHRSRQLPFGANFAVRAAEQRAFRFDPGLGRQPGRMLFGGEESDVLRRITLAGGTGVWLPEAAVEHWIDPARQTRAYLRRYYTGDGYLGTRRALEQGRLTGFGPRLRLHKRLAWQQGVYLGARLLGRSARWVPALRKAAVLRCRLIAHRHAGAVPPASLTSSLGGQAT